MALIFLTLLSLLALIPGLVVSQALYGSYSFVRHFFAGQYSYYPHIIPLQDGDIIFAHETYFSDTEGSGYDMVLDRLDNRGIVKWTKRIGSVESNDLSSIAMGSDGNIALMGRARFDETTYGVHLTKVSTDGEILLSKVYYFSGISTYGRVFSSPTGGYVITGSGKFAPSTKYKWLMFKVDNLGELEWGLRIDDILETLDKYVYSRAATVTATGDILVVGYVDKPDSSIDDTLVIKVNKDGQLVWMKTYGFVDYSFRIYHIAETRDGGFLLSTDAYTDSTSSIYVVKIDTDGNILFQATFPVYNYEWIESLIEDQDGNIVLLNGDDIPPEYAGGFILTKLSQNLEIIERKGFTYGRWLYAYNLKSLADGGYLLSAEVEDPLTYDYYAMLMKYQNDFSSCGDMIEVTLPQVNVTQGNITYTDTAQSYQLLPFTLQVYDVSVLDKPFNYTSVRQNKELCDIYDASYPPPVSEETTDNQCGCSENGTCDTDALTCTCDAGYVGQKCQYLESEIDDLINTTSAAISSVTENYQNMEPVDALTQASYLSAAPDLITSDSFSSLSSMVQALAAPGSGPVSQETMQSAMEVQSNLSQLKPTTEAEQLEVAKKISSSTSRIIEANLDSNLVIQTKQIKIKVEDIDTSQAATVAPSEQTAAEIPPGVSQCGGTSKLAAVTYGALSYSGLSTANEVKESPVFSADLYCDGTKQTVKGLETPIKLEFLVSSVRGKEVLSQIKEGVITEQQALTAGFFECRFYDEETNTLSSEGCEVVRLTETSFICECTHLTNFLSFFNKGAEVLQDSNYDVWLALPLITLESLKTNIGFYIACTYWALVSLLGILAANTDRKYLKDNRIQLLYKMSHNNTDSQLDKTIDSDASVYPVETFQGKTMFTQRRKSQNRISIDARDRSKKGVNETTRARREREKQHLDDSMVIGSDIDVRTKRQSVSTTNAITVRESKLPPLFALAKERSKEPGSCVRAKQKVQAQLQEKAAAYQHRCCCCVCCGMAKREIGDKNMLVGLCSKTSPLYSRCVRLSVLLLGVLTDITMCALFFNLEPIEDSFQFWDSLVENVWVGLYSVLLSLPFILILVFSFRVPSSVLRSFQETTSLKQLESAYRKHQARLQCHRCLGFTFFFILSNFLCLYLVAFGHVVSMTLQKNWVQSSGASLAIDLIAFEVLPALFFGAVGLLIFTCDCKCCLCALVSLDLYRVFRNIAA